jgi:tetratricopeptide (TPR) repeat protein
VKVVDPARHGHEWFWRIVAALLLAAVGWVGWVAYQLQPRSLATEQAYRAAEQARSGPIVAATTATPAPATAPVAVAPPPPPVVEEKKPAPPAATAPEPKPAEASETFKLARAIETPIAERKPTPAKPPAAAPKAAPKAAEPKRPAPSVDKRVRTKTAADAAEAQFRRAASFLNEGRVSEAEELLVHALKTDPSHAAARQAYVALLLEQRRVDDALRLLREAVAIDPARPAFALALARVHVEQRDYNAALQVLDGAGAAATGADFQAMRAIVLQRMGRHPEAVDAYQAALKGGPQTGSTWMGLGISLEALGHRAEAAQAYKRALGAGPLAGEVKEYAEARIRALE